MFDWALNSPLSSEQLFVFPERLYSSLQIIEICNLIPFSLSQRIERKKKMKPKRNLIINAIMGTSIEVETIKVIIEGVIVELEVTIIEERIEEIEIIAIMKTVV